MGALRQLINIGSNDDFLLQKDAGLGAEHVVAAIGNEFIIFQKRGIGTWEFFFSHPQMTCTAIALCCGFFWELRGKPVHLYSSGFSHQPVQYNRVWYHVR